MNNFVEQHFLKSLVFNTTLQLHAASTIQVIVYELLLYK